MKMGLEKVCGFLVGSILSLILMVNPAAACFIKKHADPEKEYCYSEVVVKGSFEITDKADRMYNFKVTQVFKAPSDMKKDVKIKKYNYDECHSVPPDSGNQYVVAGMHVDGEIACLACHLLLPFNKIRPEQKTALEHISSCGCNCP